MCPMPSGYRNARFRCLEALYSFAKSTAREAKEVRRKLDIPSRGANRLVSPLGVSEGFL
jgi:hypothetical protein